MKLSQKRAICYSYLRKKRQPAKYPELKDVWAKLDEKYKHTETKRKNFYKLTGIKE